MPNFHSISPIQLRKKRRLLPLPQSIHEYIDDVVAVSKFDFEEVSYSSGASSIIDQSLFEKNSGEMAFGSPVAKTPPCSYRLVLRPPRTFLRSEKHTCKLRLPSGRRTTHANLNRSEDYGGREEL